LGCYVVGRRVQWFSVSLTCMSTPTPGLFHTYLPLLATYASYEASEGKQLVCDVQGTWNHEDGFMLTDPVIHYVSRMLDARNHTCTYTD